MEEDKENHKKITRACRHITRERRQPMILSVNELCEYLGICRTTVWYLRKNGGLPFFRAGRRILFRKSDVDEWISKGGQA